LANRKVINSTGSATFKRVSFGAEGGVFFYISFISLFYVCLTVFIQVSRSAFGVSHCEFIKSVKWIIRLFNLINRLIIFFFRESTVLRILSLSTN